MRCCSKDDRRRGSDDFEVLRNQRATPTSSDDEGSTTTVTDTMERRGVRHVGRERRGDGSNDDARSRRGGSGDGDFDDLEAGSSERDSQFEVGVGGRRSAWDRAMEKGGSDGGEDVSPTHSTFGRDSERNRRMRKTARLVAERLGGIDSDEDDDAFEPGLGAPADVEQGFGFVSKDDVLKRKEEMERKKREEEERRAEKARRKAEKKQAKRDEREKRARLETDSETLSLLEGRENHRRKRSFFTRGSRAGNVILAVVAASAVIASAVGVILYAPTSSSKTVEIRGTDDGVLTTADPSLHPLKATTDKILHHLKHFTKSSKSAPSKSDEDDDDVLEKEKKENDSLEDVDDDETKNDVVVDDDDSKGESKAIEASLGAKNTEPEIYATSSCAPVHRDSKHGIYNQFNSACYHKKDLIGCIEPTVGGCQKCYLADSAAASQKGSYAHCSHHVCKTYNVKGCLADPRKAEEQTALESPKHDVTLSKAKRKAVPTARVSHSEEDSEEIESCLPNLEDAKRGVFQYSERSCRTLGHADVDYSGCISVGKSSCRMCVTRSALRMSTFSLCPKSVCHHHDLLFQQCAGEEDKVEDEDDDDDDDVQ